MLQSISSRLYSRTGDIIFHPARCLPNIFAQKWAFTDPSFFEKIRDGDASPLIRVAGDFSAGWYLVVPCFHPNPADPDDGVGHWTLLVAAWRSRSTLAALVLDPMGGGVQPEHVKFMSQLSAMSGKDTPPFDAARVTTAITTNLQGRSITDCGIWVMAIARAMRFGERDPVPQPNAISFLRALVTAELYLSKRVRRLMRLPEARDGRMPLHVETIVSAFRLSRMIRLVVRCARFVGLSDALCSLFLRIQTCLLTTFTCLVRCLRILI